MSFEGLFILALLLFLAGFLTTVFYFVGMRRSAAPGRSPPSVLRYFGFAAIAALVAWLAGAMLGIQAACRATDAGNLCGIWGALGTGPLLAGIVLALYGPWWRRRVAR